MPHQGPGLLQQRSDGIALLPQGHRLKRAPHPLGVHGEFTAKVLVFTGGHILLIRLLELAAQAPVQRGHQGRHAAGQSPPVNGHHEAHSRSLLGAVLVIFGVLGGNEVLHRIVEDPFLGAALQEAVLHVPLADGQIHGPLLL